MTRCTIASRQSAAMAVMGAVPESRNGDGLFWPALIGFRV